MLFLLCALLILALALGLLSTMAKTNPASLPLQHELPAMNGERTLLRGIGVDLSRIESPNMVKNPDFAPLLYKEAIPISGIEEHRVISSFSAAKSRRYADHFFDQARLRFARSSGGSQIELGGGSVESHIALVLGQGRPLNLDRQEPGHINDIAWRAKSDGTFRDVVAVGDEGHALGLLLSNSPLTLELGTRNKLVAVYADEQGYIALDELGGLYLSDIEAKGWKELPLNLPVSNWRATDVVRVNDQIFVTGSMGRLLIVEGIQSTWLQLATTTRFNAITLHGDRIILVGDNNQIWQNKAQAGDVDLAFEQLARPDFDLLPTDWKQVESREGVLLLSGTKAALLSGLDAEHLTPIETDFPEAGGPAFNVIMLSAKDFVVQIPDRVSYRSDNGGRSFQPFETPIMSTGRLFSAAADRFIGVSALNQLTIFPLEAHFTLAREVNALKLQPGDTMFLEQVSYRRDPEGEFTVADWTSSEPLQPLLQTSAASYVRYPAAENTADSPQTGTAAQSSLLDSRDYLLLLENSALSQDLDSAQLKEGLVYTVALTAHTSAEPAMSDLTTPARLSFVLSGPFPEQRLEFTHWTVEPAEHELKFVMPRLTGQVSQNSRIRLEASGSLALDHVHFGLDKERSESLSAGQNEQLRMAAPNQIRFSSLSLGSQALRTSQWLDHSEEPIPASQTPAAEAEAQSAKPSTNADSGTNTITSADASPGSDSAPAPARAPATLNMAEAMRLTRELRAQPWIVIEAYASEAEMQDLIAYLAGSVDEPLGQLRLEQGSASPWTSVFERIYLEFTDDTDVYKTPEDKAAFANHMKNAAESSPQYTQIKNKLVFVDGMDYAGARMLSAADFHGLDFPVHKDEEAHSSSFEGIRQLYQSYRLAAPRQMESGSGSPPELLRSLQKSPINETLTPAEELFLLLYDYGEGTALINLDFDFAPHEPLFELSRLSEDSYRLGLMETEELQVLSFSNGQNPTIFVWSAAPTRASIRLNTGAAQDQLKISYYDRNLQLQSTGAYPGDDREISLLPGMLVIVK